MNIYHPIGNKKIFIIKKFTKFLSYIILLILSFFLKINRSKSEIIISTAFYAPWKEDNYFSTFYSKIKNLTLLNASRSYINNFGIFRLRRKFRLGPSACL